MLQSIIILFCIKHLYEILKIKINDIVQNIKVEIKDKEQKYLIKLYMFVLGSPFSCLGLFVCYYLLKIIIILITNPVISLYANILLYIVRNVSLYFCIIICEVIIYVLNKIIIEKEKYKYKGNKTFLEEIEIISE